MLLYSYIKTSLKKLIKVHSSRAKRTFVTQSLKGTIFIMSLASQETDQPDPLRREIADHELEANAPRNLSVQIYHDARNLSVQNGKKICQSFSHAQNE